MTWPAPPTYAKEYQRPGSAARIVINVPLVASGANSGRQTPKTAAVPAMSNACPASVAPEPRALAAVSPQPAAIGTPAGSPKSRAACAVNSPTMLVLSTIVGSRSGSTPTASIRASSQRPRATSATEVKCRYEGSMKAFRPDRPAAHPATYPAAVTKAAASAHKAGSWRRHHTILGPMLMVGEQPATAVIRSPTVLDSSSTTSLHRVSSQESKEASGRCLSSTMPTPAI